MYPGTRYFEVFIYFVSIIVKLELERDPWTEMEGEIFWKPSDRIWGFSMAPKQFWKRGQEPALPHWALSFSKPFTVKAFIHSSAHSFYWSSFSQHWLWRVIVTCDLQWIGWNMSFMSQRELVSIPGPVILLDMWAWTHLYEEGDHTYQYNLF